MDEYINIPEIFGCDVFNEATMKQRLSPEIYVSWKQCIANGTALTLDVANEIARCRRFSCIVYQSRQNIYRKRGDKRHHKNFYR